LSVYEKWWGGGILVVWWEGAEAQGLEVRKQWVDGGRGFPVGPLL